MTENTLRYIRVDYASHKDALLQRIRARYPRLWNDFLDNNFGIVLVDLVAWSTATLAFIINRVAGEHFISTMTLRESAVNIGSLTGYQLRGPTASSISCEAAASSPVTAQVTISKGAVIRSSNQDSLPFEVVKDYFINTGETTPVSLVISISPSLSGSKVLSTLASVTPGSSNVDLLDTTINLSDFIQAGQVFRVTGDTTSYLIQDIQASPGAVSSNRMVLSTPYAGSTVASVTGEVYDQRIECLQGLTVQDSFVSPADSAPSYVIKLSSTPVIEGSVSVIVNGTGWNYVNSFARSSSDSSDFQFKVTSSGQPLVVFGDGVLGAILPTDATISVSYRIGGGSSGNVAINSVNTTITGLIASLSNPVTIQITNKTSPGIGGRDAETLEEARINIPAATRANDRAVTLDDYQTIAMSYPGITYARASIRTENSLLEGNVVFIYAWASGPSGSMVNLSPQLKIDLENYMQTKAVGTDLVRVGDGTTRPVPVSMRFKAFQGFNITDTAMLVQDTLNSYVDLLRPGQPILYSNLVRSLDEVYGVDTVAMATPTSDLAPANSLELFTRMDSDYSYSLSKAGVGTPVYSTTDAASITQYAAQLPVYPVEAWSIRLFLGTKELTVQPGITPGTAQVFGDNLSSDTNYPSFVNTLTGLVTLWIKGAPGDLSMKINPIQGYTSEKYVNIYVGYTGNTSQAKRREIRNAIRSYVNGVGVGSPIYASEISGVVGSKSNLTRVVSAISGVTTVNRIALDTPGNTDKSINVVETDLVRAGDVIVNAAVD